ncbi:MAG: nickel pincer cofactor biosynthesis protein LarC [Phycisphaeraceae bacterium]
MIAYLDIPSGISGDMFLGCLVDAGWPIDALRDTLRRLALPTDQWSVEQRSVMKGPLHATLVDVRAKEGHHHRHLSDICRIIEAADLPLEVSTRAIATFTRLADAEAKVHGATREKIHFHEVGAVDAIIDIVGTCAGVAALGIDRLYCGAVPLGQGWAQTAHGRIPLPAPATLELLSSVHAPTTPAPGPGELVTPTGAALLAELATFTQPALALERIGIGAGQRDTDWPNVARLWLGQPIGTGSDGRAPAAPYVQIDTNIDDMNPQLYAAVTDRLLAAGARDVWLTPVQMKKGRPAVTLSVLCDAVREAALSALILRETTTLGVRVHPVHRHEARRETRHLATPWGQVHVKLKWLDDQIAGAMPEYDDCRKLAEQAGVAVRQVYDVALAAAQQLVSQQRSAAPATELLAHVEPHEHSHDHDHDHPHDHPHPHDHDPSVAPSAHP